MSHKELPKETSSLKFFDGSGDNTVNDVLPIPIIHQTFLKTEFALLIQDHIKKSFAYDKVVISNTS